MPNLQSKIGVPSGPPKSKIAQSFGYAFAGLRYCLVTQRNFRIHIAAAIIGVIVGLLLNLSLTEWAVFATMVALVLAAEMVNTMVESLVDLVTTEYHPLAKVAKDVAAGIVLLTAIASVIVGLLIFAPKLLRFWIGDFGFWIFLFPILLP